jgi:D-3-phosphoglycerate dehydrogenase / 2-oxoglutarate reductase
MKVLIADRFEESGRNDLERLGHDVHEEPGLGKAELARVMAERDPDVLIVRSTRVGPDAIRAGNHLKLIIRAGAGYDTIDVDTASAEGVFVANCPGKNAIAVAELAWALILSCDRRVPDQTADLRAGVWNKKEYGKARGLYGRTLGLIGMGTIARAVARRAQGFGMDVVAWSRSLTPERAEKLGVDHAATPVEVAAQSDVVSVHVASTAETRHLIGAAFIAAMKPGATLINTARGSVVDEEALLRGMAEKGIRAGLDVYEGEPGGGAAAFDSALARHPAVYGTHHVGASTDQAQQAIAREAARIVAHYHETGEVLHCVNRAMRSAATCILTVRHRNRPGVLAQVFHVLSEAGINVEEMENVLYEGALAASARIQLARPPSPRQLDEIRQQCEHILSMDLTLLGQTGPAGGLDKGT